MKHREIEDGNMGKNMFRSETMKEGTHHVERRNWGS